MKNTLKKYLLAGMVLGISFVTILNSCKKTDAVDALKKADLEHIEQAKQNIKAQMDVLGGIPERVEINQRMKIGYADMAGNIVSTLPQPSTANLVSTCAGDLPDYLDLNFYYRLYTCGVGYKIKFAWTISWNNSVVLVNPNNSSNVTKGTIRISITGNANAYNNTTTDVTITDQGVDPNNSANNIYYIEMISSTLVPISVVNAPGATLRLGATFASDCSSLENYSIVPLGVTGFGWTTPLNSDPCTRNDKSWFNNGGYRQIEVTGYDPLSVCALYAAGAAPSYQQVQYSLNNGSTWTGFKNWSTSNSNILNSEFVSRIDFARSVQLAPGTYNIKIRYRNTKLNAGVSGNTLPNSSNSCATGGWATPVWTIESYPGWVIN